MPYYIKGYTNEPDSRFIVMNESDWTVEIDQASVPGYDLQFGNYEVEVVDGNKKLVAIIKPDGEMGVIGNVTPYEVPPPANFFLAGTSLGATDDTGNHTLFNGGVTVVSDPAGVGDDCLKFDGGWGGDYIAFPDSTDWDGEGGDYSIGWETYVTAVPISNMGMLTMGGYQGENRKGMNLAWNVTQFLAEDLNPLEYPYLTYDTVTVPNQWNKHIVVYSDVDELYYYYLNDSLVAQSSQPNRKLGIGTNGLGFHIGRFYNDYIGYNYVGWMRNIWIKKGALITSGIPGA